MSEWSEILEQVGKDRVQKSSNRWIDPQLSEYEPEPPPSYSGKETSFRTMKEQVRKKPVSSKSKNDRISDHSLSLSDRLVCKKTK